MEVAEEALLTAPTVFVCYARKDAKDRDRLTEALAPYVANDLLARFVDVEIPESADWSSTIAANLEAAQVGLMLVTPAWLASPFIRGVEVPRLFERRAEGSLTLHWVPVGTTNLDPDALPRLGGRPVPLTDIQWINRETKPIRTLKGDARDRAWQHVANVVKRSAVARPYIDEARPRLGARSSADLVALAQRAGLRNPLALSSAPGADLVVLAEALLQPPEDRAKIKAFVDSIT